MFGDDSEVVMYQGFMESNVETVVLILLTYDPS
jgi:hypothetical protein